MKTIAERYVKLVLKLGLYDSDYVDAYYGPEEWKPPAGQNEKSASIAAHLFLGEVNDLISEVGRMDTGPLPHVERLRRSSMQKQLVAVKAKIEMLAGKKFSFDEESSRLYDAVAPSHPESDYQSLLNELGKKLPGGGNVSARLEAYKQRFVIPKGKLDGVFKAAVSEGRRRTMQHVALPSNESFTIEYVDHKPWSGYNWYKGNSFSVIQVNTDLPIFIDRAVDLACHEGYPGHHVYNLLMEKNLFRGRDWKEFCVYPLFSPQSLIAEGSANFGIEVALPGEERVRFERDVLFPLAGLDPATTTEYYEVHALKTKLDYAGNEAARNYLDGKWGEKTAAEWLVTYALYAPDRAAQRIKFIERYRSYVINYNLGQDMVRDFIERRGGTEDKPEARWKIFEELLSEPHTPSDLLREGR